MKNLNYGPFLKSIRLKDDIAKSNSYPFDIAALKNGLNIEFKNNVTFFVGDNGTGKSTILEAIAVACGFNIIGGNKNHIYYENQGAQTESLLSENITLSWMPKINNGFFMRAESFFNFASYVDESNLNDAYGEKSLHEQSHGEAFLSLFRNRFNKGIYILDEPEAALSPNSQLAFLSLIHELEQSGKAQFLIASHSPILLAYPDAIIYHLSENGINKTSYQETEHYKLTKDFLNNTELFLHNLFNTKNDGS